ncbi:MAG: DUF4411 family protein [Planctomycetota bacterium]
MPVLTLDASAVIYAWYHYPSAQFPKVWHWLSGKIGSKELVIAKTAFDEVVKHQPDAAAWLTSKKIAIFQVTNDALMKAVAIKADLGIANDDYGSGVGENDILIIATAWVNGHEMITQENRQLNLPKSLKKYKIPAVCGMASVTIPCHTFIEVLRQSNATF